MIHIILAQASDGAIGSGGDLLWHLRGDLRRFRDLTIGHTVVMGRKTWESLPKGALPGRRNIVVSSNPTYTAPGAEVAASLEIALDLCRDAETFIIGGAQIYTQALPLASRLHLTRVDATYPQADTRMAPAEAGWTLIEASPWIVDEPSGLRYRYEEYESSNHQ